MATTMLSNLTNPQVMSDMISATLPKRIKFSPIASIDKTLEGTPGNSITIPKFAYIGDAEDVAEAVAMGTAVLSSSTTTVTVKKAGKAVEISDEALASGYGDPMGEATAQLSMSIAAKIDNDVYDALTQATLVYDAGTSAISYATIVDASSKFDDEIDDGLTKLMFINPAQEATLRKDADFIDKSKSGLDVFVTGTIGTVGGCQIVKSKKVKLVKYSKDASGSITIVDDATAESATALHLSTVMANAIDELAVGDKVKEESTPKYACPIVIVDVQDANEDPAADGVGTDAPAVRIYIKKNVNVETDRDILKKTTVASADEHYAAALTNDSKVVLAKIKG